MVAAIEVVLLVLLLSAAAGRLLGVRLPLRRAPLAGLPAIAAGIAFGYLVDQRDGDHVTAQVIGAGVLAALVTMMVVMVLAELLAPGSPGSGARRCAPSVAGAAPDGAKCPPVRAADPDRGPVRAGGPAVARADPGQLGRRLRLALEEAGPIFVKLGQVLSTRTDLLPAPVTTELASSKTTCPPRPGRRSRPC